MAVVSVDPTWDQRAGSYDASGTVTYTRGFLVRTDSANDGPLVIMTHGDIPDIGDTYEGEAAEEVDATAFAVSVSPTQHSDDPTLWTVAVSYTSDISPYITPSASGGAGSSPGGDGTNGDPSAPAAGFPDPNPLDRPVKISGTSTKIEVYRTRDLDGIKRLNSAKEPFENQQPMTERMKVLKLVKNVASFDLNEEYEDKVNSDTWRTFGAGRCKIDDVSYETASENGVAYVQITWTVLVLPTGRTWNPTYILDAGYSVLDGGGTRIVATDKLGNPYPSPVLLDGAGAKLADGDAPVYLAFRDYDTMAYAGVVP